MTERSEDEPPRVIIKPPTVKQMGDPRKEATWTMLPQPPGVCSQCGRDHEPDEPHDQQALAYQYAFYAEHERWPTWGDAMAHCTPDLQELWRAALLRRGVTEEELRTST